MPRGVPGTGSRDSRGLAAAGPGGVVLDGTRPRRKKNTHYRPHLHEHACLRACAGVVCSHFVLVLAREPACTYPARRPAVVVVVFLHAGFANVTTTVTTTKT